MLRKLFPVILGLAGLGAGIGAGKILQPATDISPPAPCGDSAPANHLATDPRGTEKEGREYVKLNNQFVIPDVQDGRVAAMIVLALSVETGPGQREAIYAREPKLRDVFLQVLFDHANAGGFRGAFTDSRTMTSLRNALREAARQVTGPEISDVLIIDIVRQDVS